MVHRQISNQAYSTISLEEKQVVYESRKDKKTEKLIDPYLAGDKNSITIKGAFIIRDTVMVTGANSGVLLASVAIFYDDLDKPVAGGTGHTISVCKNSGVPFFNQKAWFNGYEDILL